MTEQSSILDRLRRPEYTGENRCTPCTIVNSVIAIVLAAAVGLLALQALRVPVAAMLALAVLGVSAAAIALRGYLVPGTPTLTKRYFPDWLLAKFDKGPAGTAGGGLADGPTSTNDARTGDGKQEEPPGELDLESTLLRAGALEECDDVDDLCVTEEFETAWDREIEAVADEGARRERLLALLGIEEGDDLSIEEFDDAFKVQYQGLYVGRWESEAAFRADLAAGTLLEDRVEKWNDLTTAQRGELLNGVRLFLTNCPDCGGQISMSVDTVESCCRSMEVAALTCEDCGVRIFESDAVT